MELQMKDTIMGPALEFDGWEFATTIAQGQFDGLED
jgi:hypothetical protein